MITNAFYISECSLFSCIVQVVAVKRHLPTCSSSKHPVHKGDQCGLSDALGDTSKLVACCFPKAGLAAQCVTWVDSTPEMNGLCFLHYKARVHLEVPVDGRCPIDNALGRDTAFLEIFFLFIKKTIFQSICTVCA